MQPAGTLKMGLFLFDLSFGQLYLHTDHEDDAIPHIACRQTTDHRTSRTNTRTVRLVPLGELLTIVLLVLILDLGTTNNTGRTTKYS